MIDENVVRALNEVARKLGETAKSKTS